MERNEHPSSDWTYRQVLQTTWNHDSPRFLLTDRDGKYGYQFGETLKKRVHIRRLKTPFHAPKANAFIERCIGSIRRECLDHFLIFSETHLRSVLKEYIAYYNNYRTHQGIGCIPTQGYSHPPPVGCDAKIRCWPILNGLHHHYYRNAA